MQKICNWMVIVLMLLLWNGQAEAAENPATLPVVVTGGLTVTAVNEPVEDAGFVQAVRQSDGKEVWSRRVFWTGAREAPVYWVSMQLEGQTLILENTRKETFRLQAANGGDAGQGTLPQAAGNAGVGFSFLALLAGGAYLVWMNRKGPEKWL